MQDEVIPRSALGAARVCPAPGSKCGIPAILVAEGQAPLAAVPREHMLFGLGDHVRSKSSVEGNANLKTSAFV